MNNLKEYRIRAQISQRKLAELSGVVYSYIAKVETGARPLTLKTAEKFAPFLYCTPFELMGGDAIKYSGEVGDFDEIVSSLVMQYWDAMIQASGDIPREKSSRFMIAYHLFCLKGWTAKELDAVLSMIIALEDSDKK